MIKEIWKKLKDWLWPNLRLVREREDLNEVVHIWQR